METCWIGKEKSNVDLVFYIANENPVALCSTSSDF